MNISLPLGPLRLLAWFGVCLFMATAPLGCDGCVRMVTPANAQETDAVAPPAGTSPRPSLEEVASELICDNPSCSKESLKECTTCEYAVKHRNEVSQQLKQGRTKEEILNWFGDTYGEHLLGSPRLRGFGVMAFAMPALAVLLGIVPLALVFRSQHRKAAVRTGQHSPSAAMTARKEEDPRITAALRDCDF